MMKKSPVHKLTDHLIRASICALSLLLLCLICGQDLQAQVMAIDPQLKPRLKVDTASYEAAEKRIWVNERPILPVGTSRDFQRDFLSLLYERLEKAEVLELVDPRDVLRWRRAFLRVQRHYIANRALLISWKLEARWLIDLNMVPQARGYWVKMTLKDALTGEALWEAEKPELVSDEMRAWFDHSVAEWVEIINKTPEGELVALERREQPRHNNDWRMWQPDSGPSLRSMLKQADLILLHDDLAPLVSTEQRMFLHAGKWKDPYWNAPRREVIVIRHAVELYRHEGKRKGNWHPEIRLQLGQGKKARRFEFKGKWEHLCEQENVLINQLGQALADQQGWKSFKALPIRKQDRERWDAWQRLSKADEMGYHGLSGLNLAKPDNQALEKVKVLTGIVRDYPWFKPIYMELNMHPDQNRYYITDQSHGHLDEFLESRIEALGLEDLAKVNQYMAKDYRKDHDTTDLTDEAFGRKLLQLHDDDPDLAMKYFPRSLPILLYERGDRDLAYKLAMRYMDLHQGKVYRAITMSSPFIRHLIRKKTW